MNVLLISANTETINMVPLPLGLNCVAVAARDAGHKVRERCNRKTPWLFRFIHRGSPFLEGRGTRKAPLSGRGRSRFP
jgi:hypothetical protein